MYRNNTHILEGEMNISRRLFLGGVLSALLTSCGTDAGESPINQYSTKINRKHNDEWYIAHSILQTALQSGHMDAYYGIETIIPEIFVDKMYDYYGVLATSGDGYVRTKYIKRGTDYPSEQIPYDGSSSDYEYIDCAYDGETITDRHEECYEERSYKYLVGMHDYTYNPDGNEDSSTSYDYDESGNVETETYYSYTYDDNGYLIERQRTTIDEDGEIYTFIEIERECDSNNRPLRHTIYKDGRDEGVCEFEFDANGLLAMKSYQSDGYTELYEYHYDDTNRLIQFTRYEDDDLDYDKIYRYYDDFHRIEVYDSFQESFSSPREVYQFDSNGALVFIGDLSNATLYSYDSHGRVIMAERYSDNTLVGIVRYIYDNDSGLLRVQSQTIWNGESSESSLSFVIGYQSTNNGETYDCWDIDDVHDLQLSEENTLGPDISEAMRLYFGEYNYASNEILDVDLPEYREALAYADKLSKPKSMPSDDKLLFHEPLAASTSNVDTSMFIGSWIAIDRELSGITIDIYEDGTFEIDTSNCSSDFDSDNGIWYLYDSGDYFGIALKSSTNDYGIFINEDGDLMVNMYDIRSHIVQE